MFFVATSAVYALCTYLGCCIEPELALWNSAEYLKTLRALYGRLTVVSILLRKFCCFFSCLFPSGKQHPENPCQQHRTEADSNEYEKVAGKEVLMIAMQREEDSG